MVTFYTILPRTDINRYKYVFMISSILDMIKEPTKWITPSITQLNNGFYHRAPGRFLIGTVLQECSCLLLVDVSITR